MQFSKYFMVRDDRTWPVFLFATYPKIFQSIVTNYVWFSTIDWTFEEMLIINFETSIQCVHQITIRKAQ
eukprot:UN12401